VALQDLNKDSVIIVMVPPALQLFQHSNFRDGASERSKHKTFP
jgi:hypothetical protein